MKTSATSRRLYGISAAALVLVLGATGCAETVKSVKEGAEKASRQRSAFSLDPGDCFNPNSGKLEGEAFTVESMSCDKAHGAEVFGGFKLENGAFPGDKEIATVSDEKCYALQPSYAMDTWALPKGVEVYYYTPTKESWQTGDRAVSCFFGKDKGTFEGSLRADEKTLEPYQAAYLKGANAVDSAYWDAMPEEEYVEDDLKGHQKWAKKIAAALGEHVDALEGAKVPAGADDAVQDRLKDLRKAATHWAAAAKSADADAFYVAYEPADKLMQVERAVAVRKALGLATTLPADLATAQG